MSSDPLIVLDTRRPGDAGKRVRVECREPSPCMSVELYGYSAVIRKSVKQLESVHQSARTR